MYVLLIFRCKNKRKYFVQILFVYTLFENPERRKGKKENYARQISEYKKKV